MNFEISIGVPTYKRPYLLKRALNSIVKKNLNNLLVNVSVDGVDETYEEYKKIQNSFIKFKYINFYFHKKNIGTLNNFIFLRDITKTKYFMWLADDDETKPDMIIKLHEILKNNKEATSAVPYCELVNENNKRIVIKSSNFEDHNIFVRILKYTYNSDDIFFYGLHRHNNLMKCSFNKYWWPNSRVLSNWCYVFQMDLILQGKIILLKDKSLTWVNHDYGPKFYHRTTTKKFLKNITYAIRRINIYFLYLFKFFKWKKYSFVLIFFFIFLIFLLRDIFFDEPIYKKIKFK